MMKRAADFAGLDSCEDSSCFMMRQPQCATLQAEQDFLPVGSPFAQGVRKGVLSAFDSFHTLMLITMNPLTRAISNTGTPD